MDPGEKFPWQQLFRAGIGDWAPPAPKRRRTITAASDADTIAAWQRDLARYGYDAPATGIYDEHTAAVVRAFQRHFRPTRVDGVADAGTQAMLEGLLAKASAAASARGS
jgi:N-acetylmuramoyl-L-alanine amidase